MVIVVKEEPIWSNWVRQMNGLQQQIGALISYDPSYEGRIDWEDLEFTGLVRVCFENINQPATYYLPALLS